MENTPPKPDIPKLISMLKEMIERNPNIKPELTRKKLNLLERSDLPNKEPYLPIFFFIIFKKNIIVDDFVMNVLFHLRKAQLYYSFPHVQRLETTATKYFCQLFKIPSTSIQYLDKEEGKQMGAIAVITQPNGAKTKFYLKTHRKGRRREEFGSVIPKIIDTRELFVYKVLEYSHFCPKVHYFAYDPQDFYIAVKDSAIDDETGQERFICTYQDLSDHLKQKNIDFDNFTEADEDLLPPILIKELTYSYIISLILVISDTFTSFNNIIYIGTDIDHVNGFHIIDFYATPRVYEYDCSIFQAFLHGAGVDERTRYYFTKYMLISRDVRKKMATVKEAFDPDLFHEAVERAYDEVKNCIFVNLNVLEQERSNAHQKCSDFWNEYLSFVNSL